jgi:hypothetical protein
MGWDRGRYYTRSKKVHGRVVREYVGTGRLAELAAQRDDREREQRRRDAAILRDQRADWAALDAAIRALSEQVELVARAALRAAGFHQHKRGEWRKKRECREDAD